jgi:menaquinol-cytochrome c reductase iron-sulfur subunit
VCATPRTTTSSSQVRSGGEPRVRTQRAGSAHGDAGRRQFLSGIIAGIQGAIGAALAFLLGGAATAPSFHARQTNWWPAAPLDDLPEGEPTPVTIRVTREDGYNQVVDRQVLFLIKSGDAQVTALSSTCTHLGCRVSWDAAAQLLKCPCHGGVFDRTGAVNAGPPPAPLHTIETRVEGNQVLVQL